MDKLTTEELQRELARRFHPEMMARTPPTVSLADFEPTPDEIRQKICSLLMQLGRAVYTKTDTAPSSGLFVRMYSSPFRTRVSFIHANRESVLVSDKVAVKETSDNTYSYALATGDPIDDPSKFQSLQLSDK